MSPAENIENASVTARIGLFTANIAYTLLVQKCLNYDCRAYTDLGNVGAYAFGLGCLF
ncbi:MAG: hypothetical protein ACP5D2_02695 [Candidatus Nanoarchaeia archaeon]